MGLHFGDSGMWVLEAFPEWSVQTRPLLLLKTSLITSKSREHCGKFIKQAKLMLLLHEQRCCSPLFLQRNLAGVAKTAAAWKHLDFQTPGTALLLHLINLHLSLAGVSMPSSRAPPLLPPPPWPS